MPRNMPHHSTQQSLVLQPRKFHLALPLLLILIIGWKLALPSIQTHGLDWPTVVLTGSVSLALLGFGVAHLQRITIHLDRTRNEVVWEAQTLTGKHQRRFRVDDIAEFGMHRTRVRNGYAVRPAIVFKDRRRTPFPLLTVSVNGEKAVCLQQKLNAWLDVDQTALDVEIPEEEA